MDNFKEEVVTRRQGRTLNALGYTLSWFLLICFGFVGIMGLSGLMALQFSVANVLTLLVGGGVAFLLYRYKDNFRVEYEYSFTNGEMDFAMVLGNARRKQLRTPCAARADHCYDCKSPERICRAMVTMWAPILGMETEILLVDEDLGF